MHYTVEWVTLGAYRGRGGRLEEGSAEEEGDATEEGDAEEEGGAEEESAHESHSSPEVEDNDHRRLEFPPTCPRVT